MSDKRFDTSVAPDVERDRGKVRERSRLAVARWADAKANLQGAREANAGGAQGTVSLLLLLGGLACLVVGFVLLPGPLTGLEVFLALGVGLTLISLYLAFAARTGSGAVRLERMGSRIERGLERLQDAQWELNEGEARYRALLDAQEEAILRRDEAGNLSFANKAFLEMFGLKGEEALGKPYRIELCEGCSSEAPLSVASGIRRQRFVQHVVTVAGPRWIEWEEQLVAAPGGSRLEVQSVGRDVTEQRNAEMQLGEARDQAEAANRAKGRFLAAMSHEIRTPMNGILGMASLLLDTQQTAEQKTYVQAIDQSARTLLALIDEILDFSKIEAGKLELSLAPFALESLVQDVVELLAPRAHEKGLEIAWSVGAQLPRMLIGDETRVRQILLNLISNAVKFTDAGGISVRVGGTQEAMGRVRVEMAVEDTGIGLSADDMRGLFTEFEQAEAAARRGNGGTGLGLAISKQLARAMGGEILVTSRPGQGSTFVAVLMLQNAVPVGDSAVLAAPLERARVLLAFDRPLERRALCEALEAADVPVTACDFAAAPSVLQAAQESGAPFDRIVVDAAEGAAASGGLLAKARDRSPGYGVRGIVLVNVPARASLAEFRSVGFDAYLVRPVRPASLMMQLGLRDVLPAAGEHAADARLRVPAGLGASRQRRVLLAEDNEINSLLAKRVLEKCGCEHVAVTNGADAVAVMRRVLDEGMAPFDLVLMDIFMPQLDGMAAARAIKALYAERPGAGIVPPIIALTANAFAEDRLRCLEAGLDDYLAKPFDKAALESVLRRWFGPLSGGDADAA